jgi:hypothetical protein
MNAVRRAKKRKDVLRGELLAIRRERAGIAREMEAVRQGHEVGVKEMADLKVQQDFIADMEDLKARLPDTEEEDSVKVPLFCEWMSNCRMGLRLRCWRYGRWWLGNLGLRND